MVRIFTLFAYVELMAAVGGVQLQKLQKATVGYVPVLALSGAQVAQVRVGATPREAYEAVTRAVGTAHDFRLMKNDENTVLRVHDGSRYRRIQSTDTLRLATVHPDFHFPEEKQQALAAVRDDGLRLEGLDDNLKNDKDVVLAAVFQSPPALQFASEALRNDAEIARTAVELDALTLQFAGEHLRAGAQYSPASFGAPSAAADAVCLLAVLQDGNALEFVDWEPQRDQDLYYRIAKAAVQQNPLVDEFIDSEFLNSVANIYQLKFA
jgi:hypothetical protein